MYKHLPGTQDGSGTEVEYRGIFAANANWHYATCIPRGIRLWEVKRDVNAILHIYPVVSDCGKLSVMSVL